MRKEGATSGASSATMRWFWWLDGQLWTVGLSLASDDSVPAMDKLLRAESRCTTLSHLRSPAVLIPAWPPLGATLHAHACACVTRHRRHERGLFTAAQEDSSMQLPAAS